MDDPYQYYMLTQDILRRYEEEKKIKSTPNKIKGVTNGNTEAEKHLSEDACDNGGGALYPEGEQKGK